METIKLPNVEEIATVLHQIKSFTDRENPEIEVRLQLYESGKWYIRSGLSDYDQDHRGFWGSNIVSREDTKDDLTEMAISLIDQCAEHAAECGHEIEE